MTKDNFIQAEDYVKKIRHIKLLLSKLNEKDQEIFISDKNIDICFKDYLEESDFITFKAAMSVELSDLAEYYEEQFNKL